jgi:hypothetical protein
MKKTITLIFVLGAFVLSTLSSFAGDDDKKVKKGLLGGWQYSNFYKDGNKAWDDHHSSFYVGVYSNTNLGASGLIQFCSALMYFQNGSGQDENNKIKLHYLNIPVSLQVKIGPVYGFAGVNGGIKLGGEIYYMGEKSNVKDISTWDAGVHAGIGLKILIIGIEAKYNWGLVDIYEDYNSRYLQLGLKLYF